MYLILILAITLAGCKTAYYSVMEKMGKHKRDILKENVEEAKEEQGEASEQFKDALTKLKEIYAIDGGKLEAAYKKLESEYEACDERAEQVSEKIDEMEDVADDLFDEWKDEIKEISSKNLQKKSKEKLKKTRKKFDVLRDAMKKAEKRMKPVLTQLKDHVLYLKHNLNAQAIGSLKGEMEDIELEIGKLIEDMNKSITEADSFITTLGAS